MKDSGKTTQSQDQKHTPGPWHVQDVTHTEARIAYEHKGQWLILGHVFDGAEFGSQLANARLIAAAPPLLIAAQIAYTILADIRHHWEGRHTIEGQGALIALRDSIAQATGRDPQDVQDEFTNAKATS